MLNDTPRTFVGPIAFRVEGMTCRRCRDAVAEEVSRLPGVTEVVIDAATGTVRVLAGTPVDRVDVAAAVRAAGYDLRP